MWETAEIFGGVGSLSNASGCGYCFDIRRSKSMNCHTEQGLKELGTNLVMTKPNGIAMIQPTCASFLRFVSTHTSKRTKDTVCVKNISDPRIKLVRLSLIVWFEGEKYGTSEILVELQFVLDCRTTSTAMSLWASLPGAMQLERCWLW